MSVALPESVQQAQARATTAGFALSCEPSVGRLLASLAAGVPSGGRVLELGTGVGAGLAWIVHGLGRRRDVQVVSVELDPAIQAIAREADWPDFVRFESGDGAERAAALGGFDLVFADAPGGKLRGLEASVSALRPRGVLLVDDMDPSRHEDPELVRALAEVRDRLVGDARLVCTELDAASGVILCTRSA